MKYEPVIGLEIHIQAKTKSKMFCFCDSNYFGDAPNTHICPVCLGLPGALPVPNRKGIEQAIRLSVALDCKINQETKFDRKNYFYPDLPKGYQISQYDLPIGYDGQFEIEVEGDARRIRITRVHLEEDTGKSVHDAIPGKTALDFNKSGVALIEVVTEPDFQDAQEVDAFARLLKQTVEYLGVSDAEMQKGQMRFELNISLKRPEEKGLPDYKVEVKNIGSISVLEKVIEFEIARQTELLDKGEEIVQQTRGIRNMSGETYEQRVKETADDYRYFPEPDIPPIHILKSQIEEIKESLPELPAARRARYISKSGLAPEQADILVAYPDKGAWLDSFEQQEGITPEIVSEAAKWFIGEISGQLEKNALGVASLPVSASDLLFLINSMHSGKISGSIAKKVIEDIFSSGGNAEDIVSSQNLEQISDEGEIKKLVEKVISDNPEIVESIKRNPKAKAALVGKTMGMSKGKANPQAVSQVIDEIFPG